MYHMSENYAFHAGVEFKQKFQLASRTSRYKNQLAPQIFYQPWKFHVVIFRDSIYFDII